MLSYLLEKFVRRLCGRWLRNFSAENLSVSLGGTVSFDDLWLNTSELNLFDFPQNTWGGENMLVYLLSAVLGLTVHNPCETLRAVHLHCELALTNLLYC